MPKVSKKDAKEQAALQPVPMVMDADDDNPPSTSEAQSAPKFPPMSVFDQNGRKVDFRRVGCIRLPSSFVAHRAIFPPLTYNERTWCI